MDITISQTIGTAVVSETVTVATVSNVGAQGATGATGAKGDTGNTGPSGVIAVTSPITNTGSSTSATIGIDQTLLSISPSQVTGTAVITTDSRLSDSRTPSDASVTDAKIATTLSPSKITGTAAVLGANTFTGKQTFPASTTSIAAFNIPSSVTNPTSPTNGDFWVSFGGFKFYNGSATKTFLFSDDSNTFTATNYFSPTSNTDIPLVARTAASATGSVQEWRNSADTVLMKILSNGALTLTPSANIALTVNGAASSVTLQVKPNATGTSNQQEWYDTGSTLRSYVTSTGRGNFYGLSVGFGSAYSAAFAVNTITDQIGAVIRANAATQSANLQEWQSSGGTVLGGRNAAGQTYAGSTAAVVGSTTTAITSAAYTSATVAVFTYGGTSLVQAGQTVTVAGVTGGAYNGTWVVTAVTSTTFTVLGSGFTNNAGTGGTFQLSAAASFTANTAATPGLVVKGAASQTVDLFQVQNSSGSVRLGVNSAGVAYWGGGVGSLNSQSSGGTITAQRATAAASNPGANLATLYFRDGTTAGTLKLVVRAGTAGAETTILDNIPTT